MNETVENTKTAFLATKGRLLKTFDATPNDRLNWSPSESARTPIELVAHCANSLHWLHTSFAGEPMPKLTTAEFDELHLSRDKQFHSREQVVAHLEAESAAFLSWLDQVSEEQLASTWQSPFGGVPMTLAITFPARHADGHVSQLEYVQTIYGDRVWH
jgi:hypothetical protein